MFEGGKRVRGLFAGRYPHVTRFIAKEGAQIQEAGQRVVQSLEPARQARISAVHLGGVSKSTPSKVTLNLRCSCTLARARGLGSAFSISLLFSVL